MSVLLPVPVPDPPEQLEGRLELRELHSYQETAAELFLGLRLIGAAAARITWLCWSAVFHPGSSHTQTWIFLLHQAQELTWPQPAGHVGHVHTS